MRVPQSWLNEVVRRGAPDWTVTGAELESAFIDLGHEVEELTTQPELSGPVVVGRVSTIEELTEFRKPIRLCRVDVGEAEDRQIVCGARNFAVGDLVVVSLPGAVLAGGFAISARKTYGNVSDGMICSTAELGFVGDSAGILVLRPGTAEPGADAIALLGAGENVIELEITPDRGYASSLRGLGRDLAAAFDLDYVDPVTLDEPLPAGVGGVAVTIDPASDARRYTARLVRGIDPTAATPWWIERRLLTAGIRTISPAVDVTNYVLLELGQPLHAFDASTLTGGITVRRAVDGEKLTTLDGVDRALVADDVVIADESGPIALAGVMGGAATEVGDATTDVLLESACFSPVAVLRCARRYKLFSEAARRFERGVDPRLQVVALDRAARLLVEIAGGTVDDALSDVGTAVEPVVIGIDADRPGRVAGVDYAPGTTRRRLEQIGCAVAGDAVLSVTPPSWRPDLLQQADLVEEVLRLEGLEQIPSVLPSAPAGRGLTQGQRRRRALTAGIAAAGYVEVLPYPFLPAGVFDAWGLPGDDRRRRTASVLNPLESDRAELASTLLPGLLEIAGRNVARGQRDLSLYTVAQVFLPTDATHAVPPVAVDRRPSDETIAELVGSLPSQPLHVAAVLTGLREPAGPWGRGRPADAVDAFELARTVGRLAQVDVELRAAQEAPWHPGRCAAVVVDGVVVGHAGELHPAVLERTGMPKRMCAVEIDLDAIAVAQRLPAPHVSPFPPVLQDVSVVVDAQVAAEDVRGALCEGAGELLEDIRVFDVFTGEQIGEGRKSLTFSLVFRAADRTLTEDEASAARDAAVAVAAERTGAALRG